MLEIVKTFSKIIIKRAIYFIKYYKRFLKFINDFLLKKNVF